MREPSTAGPLPRAQSGPVPGRRPAARIDARYVVAAALIAAFGVLPLLVPTLADPLTVTLSLGLAALAVALLMRAGLYYAVGAYAVAYANRWSPRMDVLGLLLLGGAAAGLIAWVVALFVVRYRGMFFAMLNLALAMVAYTLLLKLYHITGGSDGLPVSAQSIVGTALAPAVFSRGLFYLTLGLTLGAGILVTRYLDSPAGWALGAIAASEIRIEYLGVSTRRVLTAAYVVSGVLAGLAGAIVAVDVGRVVADLAYWTASSDFLFVAILGGSGTVFGPFAGAVVYEWLSLFGARYMANSWNLVLGLIIIGMLRLAPEGLWGLMRPRRKGLVRERRAA
jgi:branched-chain amino acid transport system permease protein